MNDRFDVIPMESLKRVAGNGSATLLLVALAMHADQQGQCWPSRETLCKLSGLSVATFKRALKELVDRHCVEIVKKGTGRQHTVYGLVADYWRHPFEGARIVPPEGSNLTPWGLNLNPEHTIEQTIKKKAIGRDEFLPEGWQPSADNLGKLKAKYPGMNADAIVEAFIDYWQSRGDARAKKRDWNAALRVWFSNEAKRSPSNVKRNYKPGFTEEDRRRLLESADRAVAGTSAVHDFFGKRGCADR